MEASSQTVGEFLEAVFPGRDIAAELDRGLSFVESFADRISAVLKRVAVSACEQVERFDGSPPRPDYKSISIDRNALTEDLRYDCAKSTSVGDLRRGFGANDDKLAAIERFLGEIVERAHSLVGAAAPTILAWGDGLYAFSQQPETPGHEKLFRELLGYNPLMAKLLTRAVHHCGKLLADEINQSGRVRALLGKIVKTKGCSVLVISRRARKFRDQCNSHGAHIAIQGAIEKAGLFLDAFDQLVDAACERNEDACPELVRIAALLAPHLRKCGRPISSETCIHILFYRYLESQGISCSYTYSDVEGSDFVDQMTRATRLAVNSPRFSPLYANKLRKDKERVPPFEASGRKPQPNRHALRRS